jgi:hypothetical protein
MPVQNSPDEVVKSALAEGVAETKSRLGWCECCRFPASQKLQTTPDAALRPRLSPSCLRGELSCTGN